jgi:hypothetical protein
LLILVCYLIYFPGQQGFMAISLASGLGLHGIQARVNGLEAKAIKDAAFTPQDKRFLHDLYACFAKGGRLTIILRQTGGMMAHYLSANGTPYKTGARIFLKNKKVRARMADLKDKMLTDIRNTRPLKDEYASPTFYMPDPSCLDSLFGLYYGRLILRREVRPDGRVQFHWRAEVPWEWPSYESQTTESKNPHAKTSRIPDILAFLGNHNSGLLIDDGLGEYLVRLGLAKPFLLFSEWTEILNPNTQ